MKYLADNIRYLRKKFGWSQEHLAEMMGLNRGNIASYEKGTAEPKIQNLLKMIQIFKIEVKDLVEKDLAGIEKIDKEISDLKDNSEGADYGTDFFEKKRELLRKLVTKDEKLQNFVKHSDEMKKILQGFKSFHHFKMKNGHRLSDDVKKISDDYEKLLELMESMIETNQGMIQYLEEKSASTS